MGRVCMSCKDHTLAHDVDTFIYQSQIIRHIMNKCKGWNDFENVMSGLSSSYKARKITPSQLLDRRRSMLSLFNFCPDCGEKINWSKIKKDIKGRSENE